MIRLSTLTKYLDVWCVKNDACYSLVERYLQVWLDRQVGSPTDYSGRIKSVIQLKQVLAGLSTCCKVIKKEKQREFELIRRALSE